MISFWFCPGTLVYFPNFCKRVWLRDHWKYQLLKSKDPLKVWTKITQPCCKSNVLKLFQNLTMTSQQLCSWPLFAIFHKPNCTGSARHPQIIFHGDCPTSKWPTPPRIWHVYWEVYIAICLYNKVLRNMVRQSQNSLFRECRRLLTHFHYPMVDATVQLFNSWENCNILLTWISIPEPLLNLRVRSWI